MQYLLSESDVEDVVEALDYILKTKGSEFVEVKRNRFTMLRAWIKLLQSKNNVKESKCH